MTKVQNDVYGWEFNLFAVPLGYFEEHTAEELGICEEARQILIKEQEDIRKRKNDPNRDKILEAERRKEEEELKKMFGR